MLKTKLYSPTWVWLMEGEQVLEDYSLQLRPQQCACRLHCYYHNPHRRQPCEQPALSGPFDPPWGHQESIASKGSAVAVSYTDDVQLQKDDNSRSLDARSPAGLLKNCDGNGPEELGAGLAGCCDEPGHQVEHAFHHWQSF